MIEEVEIWTESQKVINFQTFRWFFKRFFKPILQFYICLCKERFQKWTDSFYFHSNYHEKLSLKTEEGFFIVQKVQYLFYCTKSTIQIGSQSPLLSFKRFLYWSVWDANEWNWSTGTFYFVDSSQKQFVLKIVWKLFSKVW